jgi:hypothetical protein
LFSEHGLDRSAALEDKYDLVGAAILIVLEFAVRFFGTRAPRRHVLIEENRNATAVEIALPRDIRGAQMVMAQRTVGCFLQLLAFQQVDAAHARRRTQMIHDRVGFVKSLRGDDVFVGDTFVFKCRRRAIAMKPNVMFSRNLAELMIKWHCLVLLQIASAILFLFKRFKERFEIAFAETLSAFALNNFEE